MSLLCLSFQSVFHASCLFQCHFSNDDELIIIITLWYGRVLVLFNYYYYTIGTHDLSVSVFVYLSCVCTCMHRAHNHNKQPDIRNNHSSLRVCLMVAHSFLLPLQLSSYSNIT